MKFQKDNSANRLTSEILAQRREAEENKRKAEEAKRQLTIERAEEARKAREARAPFDRREAAYPELREQLDLLWHDMDNGLITIDKEAQGTWYQKIKTIKEEHPLP